MPQECSDRNWGKEGRNKILINRYRKKDEYIRHIIKLLTREKKQCKCLTTENQMTEYYVVHKIMSSFSFGFFYLWGRRPQVGPCTSLSLRVFICKAGSFIII